MGGLEWEENASGDEDENVINKQDEESENPLITSLSNDDNIGDRKARKAEMWFQKIGDLEDDSDLEEAELKRAVDIVEKKGGSIKRKEAEETSNHIESDDEDEVGNIHHETVETDSDDSERGS